MKADCLLSSRYYNETFSCILFSTLRFHGKETMSALWSAILTEHQKKYFILGLRKLGIENEEPAVAAAKYHYFSNALGGMPMEYVEESPRKVWIRYLAPAWSYSGASLAALPLGVRRAVFSSWHPNNGYYMGAENLGWVSTKLIDEGDPYDEGYFETHDHVLRADERCVFRVADKTPPFEPAKAPKLDPADWPEERVLRAKRNYAGGYVAAAARQLERLVGRFPTAEIVGHAMRIVAIQYTQVLAERMGVGEFGVSAIASFHAALAQANKRHCEIVSSKPDRISIFVDRDSYMSDLCEEVRDAFFEFQRTSVRIMNGSIEISRALYHDGEIWTFEDRGRWLW